jgi:hypothetical protein
VHPRCSQVTRNHWFLNTSANRSTFFVSRHFILTRVRKKPSPKKSNMGSTERRGKGEILKNQETQEKKKVKNNIKEERGKTISRNSTKKSRTRRHLAIKRKALENKHVSA